MSISEAIKDMNIEDSQAYIRDRARRKVMNKLKMIRKLREMR